MSATTEKDSSPANTRWHVLLGAVLDPLLQPVGIDVLTELPVMKTPPTADILLLRRHGPAWSPEQMARLPDGIRDTRARHVLIEFKYTESVNEDTLCQAVGYDYFYRKANNVKMRELQSVLVRSRTPQSATLKTLGYRQTTKAGVFRSESAVVRKILLLSLNGLANTPYNAVFKCFASRRQERAAAFETLQDLSPARFSGQFWQMIKGLWVLWSFRGGETMSGTLTPHDVSEMGKKWGEHFLSGLTVAERLAGLKPEEVLRYYAPEDRLAGLKPEDRLAGLKPEDRLAGLKPEEIERYLRRLKGFSSKVEHDREQD